MEGKEKGAHIHCVASVSHKSECPEIVAAIRAENGHNGPVLSAEEIAALPDGPEKKRHESHADVSRFPQPYADHVLSATRDS